MGDPGGRDVKVCISTHTVPSFGEIPAGSLWEDESPYVVEADCFADVDATPAPQYVRKPRQPKES